MSNLTKNKHVQTQRTENHQISSVRQIEYHFLQEMSQKRCTLEKYIDVINDNPVDLKRYFDKNNAIQFEKHWNREFMKRLGSKFLYTHQKIKRNWVKQDKLLLLWLEMQTASLLNIHHSIMSIEMRLFVAKLLKYELSNGLEYIYAHWVDFMKGATKVEMSMGEIQFLKDAIERPDFDNQWKKLSVSMYLEHKICFRDPASIKCIAKKYRIYIPSPLAQNKMTFQDQIRSDAPLFYSDCLFDQQYLEQSMDINDSHLPAITCNLRTAETTSTNFSSTYETVRHQLTEGEDKKSIRKISLFSQQNEQERIKQSKGKGSQKSSQRTTDSLNEL